MGQFFHQMQELKEKVCRRIAEKHLQHIEDGAYDPQEA